MTQEVKTWEDRVLDVIKIMRDLAAEGHYKCLPEMEKILQDAIKVNQKLKEEIKHGC